MSYVGSNPSPRRLAGAAGLGYVALVGIENMNVLETPTPASGVAEIRDAYQEDFGLLFITGLAGILALFCYVVFAVLLLAILCSRERRVNDSWVLVGLVGAIGGPLLAGTGAAANAIVVSRGEAALGDDALVALFDLYGAARTVAGLFVALFLLGVLVLAVKERGLPRPLVWLGGAVGVAALLMPAAAFGSGEAPHVAVAVGYGAYVLWIFLTSLWLALADGVTPPALLRRGVFLLVALAAGLVGAALLAFPESTGEFFSWGLQPAPLAALAGGFYIAAAATFAAGLRARWNEARALVIGGLVLSVSVLVATLIHLDQFNFDRLQAWAWVVLFAAFPLAFSAILLLHRRSPASMEPDLTTWARAVLVALAATLLAAAVVLWADPDAASGPSPFELPPLGSRFIGSWIGLLGVLAGVAAARGRLEEARLPLAALVTFPAGALFAALRTPSDLDPAGAGVAYVAAFALIPIAALVVLARGRMRPSVSA
jgi:hypothetical protein